MKRQNFVALKKNLCNGVSCEKFYIATNTVLSQHYLNTLFFSLDIIFAILKDEKNPWEIIA